MLPHLIVHVMIRYIYGATFMAGELAPMPTVTSAPSSRCRLGELSRWISESLLARISALSMGEALGDGGFGGAGDRQDGDPNIR